MLSKLFASTVLLSNLYSDCMVDYSLMFTVAANEKHLDRDIGYPYLISFNNLKDTKKISNTSQLLDWLDTRTLDCHSEKNCINLLSQFNKSGVNNLDLGAYQINQESFFYKDFSNYFNLKKSYQNACGIIYSHYKETGKWDWNTIARYHSKTKSINNTYALNLQKNYSKLKQQGKK